MRPPRSLAAATLAVHATATTDCCGRLSRSLGDAVNFPGSGPYNATEASYWSLQESDLKPACIVRPTRAQDVSKAMSIIGCTPQCKFAVKGQGHSPAAGFANVDGGVTLDMTALASIETSSDLSVAKVGAGASWIDVYRHLEPLGIAIPGGRNGNVGVGGLLLGGGISHFTTRVGWACDSIVNYEIALANGKLVNANRTSHPDLFRALKGGASNFGVVTRFDLATFPQGNISSTSLVHEISQREAVLTAFADIAGSNAFDPKASLVMGLLFNSTSRSWIMSTAAVYTEPVLHPSIYANLSSIPSVSNKSVITSLATLADEAAMPPLNWLFATATFKSSPALLMDMFEALNDTLYSFYPPGGIVWDVALEPLAGGMLSQSQSNADNVLGIGPGDNGFKECAQAKGMLQRFQYLNYAAPYQNPLRSYGNQNLNFLRNIAASYDPKSIFQHRSGGGFKLT
ncbi:FAD-binding protein [Purpureocillium lavendulum]|uniref:FAD-binding protein n=1 Tax=Purpureocillium lavendulum TaxID=1247861 RepID=A0AB34G5C7_9HYPO|nr:FAD-binding protein [Purpureocillium lavendulum]